MYHSGSVSWTDAGGEYFIQTVDRTKLNDYLNRKTKKTRKQNFQKLCYMKQLDYKRKKK